MEGASIKSDSGGHTRADFPYTQAVGYWVKECSKDKLVLERFEVNTDGPNLLEGDVTFKKMGVYTK